MFAAPEGRVLVWGDYSQIELRIAAQIAHDDALLKAFESGEDIHAVTARLVGVDRKVAKGLNFGLLYGMGARRFAENSGLPIEEATEYRRKFFAAYPGLKAWHSTQLDDRGDPLRGETRTLASRRRLDVRSFSDRLNSPVQGSGADGLKAAIAALFERDRPSDTFLELGEEEYPRT